MSFQSYFSKIATALNFDPPIEIKRAFCQVQKLELEMMSVFVALLLSLFCICSTHGQERVYEGILRNTLPYPLPELHFTYEALEPEIDSATVRVHHTGHHKAYTDNMNRVLTEWRTEVS